jgi:L-methionine (R)-S-oxide reductase
VPSSREYAPPELWENVILVADRQAMSDNEFLDKITKAAGDRAKVIDLILERLKVETGTIHELGPDGLLHLKAWAGGIPELLLNVIRRIPVGKGIAGLAVERCEPINLCNLQSDDSGDVRPRARETGVQGSICVPMMAGPKAVGALGVATREERDFTDNEVELLMRVGRALVSEPPAGTS